MKGKSYSIPIGMVFKKYSCCKCGNVLKKEKTHRVVTKDDKDYYQYQDYNTFPRRDYDVYDYRFKCPTCNNRISFNEQCIIERIQKKCKSKILNTKDIKNNYKACKYEDNKRVMLRSILVSFTSISLFFLLFYFIGSNKSDFPLVGLIVIYIFLVIGSIIRTIKEYKGNYKLRHLRLYSHEEEANLNRLHAYSAHNKSLVINSKECYCFYCKEKFDSLNVEKYIDNGQTALCPKCGVDSVLPDSIEGIDEKVVNEMHKYWF